MRRTETKQIGALEVTTMQLPSMAGSRLRFKLLKMLLPAAGALRGKALGDLMKLDVADVAPGLLQALQAIDERSHDALMLEILAGTSVVGADDKGVAIKYELNSAKIIDLAFGGDVDALWSTARFALEVNLGGFFDASGRQLAPQVQTPSG